MDGIVSKDSNDETETLDDRTGAVAYSVLAREAVIKVSATSGMGTASIRLRAGVTVVVTVVDLVISVKSEDGQMS